VLASTLVTAGSVGAQTRAIQSSWGKPGVSFAHYRADAIECGVTGHYTDVSQTEAAKVFVAGSRRINTLLDNNTDARTAQDNAIQSARVVEAVRPVERRKEIKVALLSAVEQCLASRGYQRFRLLETQREELRRMPKGSEDRHVYLHRFSPQQQGALIPGVLRKTKGPPRQCRRWVGCGRRVLFAS
jgi:hypothetical protein